MSHARPREGCPAHALGHTARQTDHGGGRGRHGAAAEVALGNVVIHRRYLKMNNFNLYGHFIIGEARHSDIIISI